MNESKKMKVIMVAMSGGIDSSVTAILLQEQGYIVNGITMKLFDAGDRVPIKSRTTEQARVVAQKLSIPLEVIDMRERFRDTLLHIQRST